MKYALGDTQGTIADYTTSIQLNPKNADAYFNRGFVNRERGEKQKALVDFQESARLYKLQGNTTWFNNAQKRIRELGGSL